jgi:hypothetical protein
MFRSTEFCHTAGFGAMSWRIQLLVIRPIAISRCRSEGDVDSRWEVGWWSIVSARRFTYPESSELCPHLFGYFTQSPSSPHPSFFLSFFLSSNLNPHAADMGVANDIGPL